MKQKSFKIVLLAPEIPGNTGSIGRTCVALGLDLILIKPYGFDLSEKAVRRAGLDYWKHVNIKEYENFDEFLQKEAPSPDQLLFFENNVDQNFYDAPYSENCYLIFGSETKGLPKDFYQTYKDRMFHLPMFSDQIRSLNLSNTATTVAFECLRCLN
ncbi:MAG: tRNA (cytidine/uridine-2'-O-)-methyltransferase [Bacteriovoracaceae bacterium]